ncbi:PQQ-dependent sugar dehydrogenase [Vulgatibacter sp.]|uniref:PQQ-dependent sugar dehydrogenase n=1 Tax=Vulgatibacter sp. TaxID=1971226 RepID=UPI00356B3FFE
MGVGRWLALATLVVAFACTEGPSHAGQTGGSASTGGSGSGGTGGSGGIGGSGGGTAGTDCADEPAGTPAPFGLDKRPANPTCLAPPRPQAAAAAVQLRRVFPALRFDQPLLLLQAPGDGSHWYVVEKEGRVFRFEAREDVQDAEIFVDLRGRVSAGAKEAGLLGMAFHPDWPGTPEVFFSYTSSSGGFHSVLSRFRTTSGGTSVDAGSEELVLAVDQPRDYHNGGHIVFGPDRMLYFGLGDGGLGNNSRDDRLLLARLLRLDVIGGRPYAIPADNPFVGGPLRPEVWASGFRNPWRFSFDRETGALWLGDVGQEMREEINRVERGKHYGWNVLEGTTCHKESNCDPSPYVPPVIEYDRRQGQSVTGGFVYRGSALPALQGCYLYGDFVTGRVWCLFPGDTDPELLIESGLYLATFGESADGEIYTVDHFGGGLYRLDTIDGAAGRFPGRLSETGCVDPANPRAPLPGLVPYGVNVPLWSDGTHKDRWMAIPDGTVITVAENGHWEFPIGTVLVKNFRFGCRLVETRLFVRHDDGGWAGYTYEWNEEQTDAFLLADYKEVQVGEHAWAFPSRAQCMQCHSAAAGRSLGPETGQLDREVVWPNGRRSNFIDTVVQVGLVDAMPDRSAGPYADPDGSAHVEARAKSYLHANCSSCHRPGSTGQGAADYRYSTPLAEMGICDVEPEGGDFNVRGARLLVPGSPEQSVIPLRMRALDSTRMPQVGTKIVHEAGVAAVEDWIRWLDACP